MVAVLVACALLVGFFMWERGSRQGAEARSFARGAFDRGSTLLLASVFALGFVLLPVSLLLNARGIGRMDVEPAIAAIGIGVMLLGIALRIWASRVLGRYFTRTLRAAADQPVVQGGPYRLVRHPGYLGDIALWTGAAFATLNWIAFAVLTLAAFAAYRYRIQAEETMLRATIGEPYRQYARQTRRLIPFIY